MIAFRDVSVFVLLGEPCFKNLRSGFLILRYSITSGVYYESNRTAGIKIHHFHYSMLPTRLPQLNIAVLIIFHRTCRRFERLGLAVPAVSPSGVG